MTEPLRKIDPVHIPGSFSPKLRPRVIELIRQQLQGKDTPRTDSISGESPYILHLPELHTIGWLNADAAGEPYPDLWSHVFGDFDIDGKFDSIPGKVQASGCYLGIFQGCREVPRLWEAIAWNCNFFLAVEVDDFSTVPEALMSRIFPSSQYAVFIAKGTPGEAYFNTWNYIQQEWFPASEYRFNEAGVFFINFTEESGPDDERFRAHLCVPVVKK
ncbi:GyrI-like domain-containing protein [Paenibacillus tengchongensis]|uniref:GyrI-like domain-containing protein n=1 Tax=Paenibacillus tengchongensis TaxID=2608684 RepID=UPI00124E2DEB|nr:effector binding domain-containing protein [Paenibacillus tengchongensis]